MVERSRARRLARGLAGARRHPRSVLVAGSDSRPPFVRLDVMCATTTGRVRTIGAAQKEATALPPRATGGLSCGAMMSPDEATHALGVAAARHDAEALDHAVEALREPVREALRSVGLPAGWLDDELRTALTGARSASRGWVALRGELRAMARRSHRAALARATTDETRLAKLRDPARRFVEARTRTRDLLLHAWSAALLERGRAAAGPPRSEEDAALRAVSVAAARAHASSGSIEDALRAAVEAIVRADAETRAKLREARAPSALPTAIASDYVIARELRSEGGLRADGTVERRTIQWVVVEATLDALLASAPHTSTPHADAHDGDALSVAQREAMEHFVALLPFLDVDLRRSLPRVAPFLARTEISERELVDHALERLRARGVRPEGAVREPYLLLVAWLRSAAARRAVDAYRARRTSVDPSVLERVADDEASGPHALDVVEGERGAAWWLTHLDESLTPKLRETLRAWRARESISSVELAIELGLIAARRVEDAEAGDEDAQRELKRACNQIDTRRKRIREHARRLVDGDERRAG